LSLSALGAFVALRGTGICRSAPGAFVVAPLLLLRRLRR
jgi:hypothetical protein